MQKEGAWPRSCDPYNIRYTLEHISKISKAIEFKFGKRMHMAISPEKLTKSRKALWPGS